MFDVHIFGPAVSLVNDVDKEHSSNHFTRIKSSPEIHKARLADAPVIEGFLQSVDERIQEILSGNDLNYRTSISLALS